MVDMKRINVWTCFGLLVAMMLMASCQEKGTDGPGKKDDNISLTVLVGSSTKELIEGTVTVTFEPSGKTAVYNIGSASAIPDKNLFQLFYSNLKLLFGEDGARKWWDEVVSIGGTVSCEKDDTQFVISKDYRPKAGVSLTEEDSYDIVLAIDYKVDGKGTTDNCSFKGMKGNHFADWCTRMSGQPSTHKL